MTEKEAYAAFNLTDRIGSVGVAGLAGRHGSVAAAWEAYKGAKARSGAGVVDVDAEFAKASKYKVEIITPADGAYPDRLRQAPGHPLALYVKGDVKALSAPSVAIVGTRRATQYGLDRAASISEALAESGMCVLSGLALGIDAEAHKGALAAHGTTVGIIGSGLDEFYPGANRALARKIVENGGAVASEFPFGRKPDTKTFPQRNHVVAALCRGLVVVESPSSGGSLITASFAGELGRPVMAVPGRVDSRSSAGCNRLIREGARLVRDAADVLEEIGGLFPELGAARTQPAAQRRGRAMESRRPCVPLGAEELLVLSKVDAEGVDMDELVRLTGLGAAKVNAVVMSLRCKEAVRIFPGNVVALPRAD